MAVVDVLFLDQTGQLGGAELALSDIVVPYRNRCLVVLFEDGPFRRRLESEGTPVKVLRSSLADVRRESSAFQGLLAAPKLLGLAVRTAKLARRSHLIYANSQKALLVGAVAARLARRDLVFHLHDILSPEHFSSTNRKLSVAVANRACRDIVANSEATRDAFVQAGGDASKVSIVSYGFSAAAQPAPGNGETDSRRDAVRADLGFSPEQFVIGHFSRLSPWKGQEVLLRALARSPANTVGLFVGDALFGEEAVARALQADAAGLGDRAVFTGFRSDVAELMAACDLIVHSSTAPEPFGRVIVEAMLAGVPVVAARAGGPLEIIDEAKTGWLTPPGDDEALASRIMACLDDRAGTAAVALAGKLAAQERYGLDAMHAALAAVIDLDVGSSR